MSRFSKLFLIGAGGLAGLMILVAVVATYTLRQNARPRLEAMASQQLEMDVRVDGELSVGFFPRLHVVLTDVHAGRRGADIASADEVEVGIAFLPLLHQEVRIRTIGLHGLRLRIERDRDGVLNIRRSPPATSRGPALTVTKLSVSDGTLHYSNRQSGKEFEANECNLEASRMRISSGTDPGLLKNLSLAAKLDCSRIATPEFAASDLRVSVEGRDGIFQFDPLAMDLFGGRGPASCGRTSPVPCPFTGLTTTWRISGWTTSSSTCHRRQRSERILATALWTSPRSCRCGEEALTN